MRRPVFALPLLLIAAGWWSSQPHASAFLAPTPLSRGVRCAPAVGPLCAAVPQPQEAEEGRRGGWFAPLPKVYRDLLGENDMHVRRSGLASAKSGRLCPPPATWAGMDLSL